MSSNDKGLYPIILAAEEFARDKRVNEVIPKVENPEIRALALRANKAMIRANELFLDALNAVDKDEHARLFRLSERYLKKSKDLIEQIQGMI